MTSTIIEGKTKVIRRGEKDGEVILETKDELTGGDAAKRETIQGIAASKTTQTSNVFRLLESHGIPTSFIRPLDERSIVCHECDMLPLELVSRRYAYGSFLQREPELANARERPLRFDEVRQELFHKHAVVMPPLVETPIQMEEGEARKLYLHDGKWQPGVHTDPLVQIDGGRWFLYSAHAPLAGATPLMETTAVLDAAEVVRVEEEIMAPTFEVLEQAWAAIETADGPVALVDMKIEVGRRKSDGVLVVADVIDNDSWRIWPGADPTRQLDKQCFREDHPLHEVAEKYELVTALSERFVATPSA